MIAQPFAPLLAAQAMVNAQAKDPRFAVAPTFENLSHHYLDREYMGRYAVSTPEVFAFLRRCPYHALGTAAVDHGAYWPLAVCDTWYITLAAGDISRLWEHFPHPLPYIAWYRTKKNALYLSTWDRMKELTL